MFLSLSPRVTTATAPDPTFVSGYLDAATISGVSGWAGPGPTHVTVTVNSVLVATVLTDQARPDVLAFPQFSTFGVCGFSYSFSPALDGTIIQHIVVACQASTITNGDKTLPGSGGGGGTAGYITDPALQAGAVVQQGIAATMPNNDSELGSHPSVLFYEPMDSTAGVKSRWTDAGKFYDPGGGNGYPSIDVPTVFVTDPKSGVRLMQIPIQIGLNSVAGRGGTGSSWYHSIADQTLQDLYFRYLLVIYPDVNPVYDPVTGVETNGMNDIGVKLPGPAGAYEHTGDWNENLGNIGQNGWSHRFWHAAPVAYNIFPFRTYTYDYTANVINGNPFGDEDPIGNTAARGGQVYCVEHRVKLNTITDVDPVTHKGTPVADGISEWWIDGVKVYSDTARKIRANTRANFQEFFQNVFHGGSNPVIGRITYAVGGNCIATEYIGPPKRVVSSYRNATSDAFFAALPLMQWTDLPNSSMSNLLPQIRSDYLEYGLYSGHAHSPGSANIGGLAGLLDWSGGAWDDTHGDFHQVAVGGHDSTNYNGHNTFSPELAVNGTHTYHGWVVLRQPSVYDPTDYIAWRAAQSGDVHYENGYGYPNDHGTWKDGQPVSKHGYNDPCWVPSKQAVMYGQQHASPDSFWVLKADGTYSQIAGNAVFGNLSTAFLQGNRVYDSVNNVLLGFQNWPNGASIGVRRFNLNTSTDMAPIDLTNLILSQDSNYTAGLYYTETTWCQTGAGCMVGREFHYAMSEGSQRYFRINIDTWVAKELKLTGLPARIGTSLVYASDTGKLYALSCDTGLLMSGDPFTGAWANAVTSGTGPVPTTQMLLNGVWGRFFYYSARKCLVAITDAAANVKVIRIA